MINTSGKDYYKEFEEGKDENQGFIDKVKQSFMLKKSSRKKEKILPILAKMDENIELSG